MNSPHVTFVILVIVSISLTTIALLSSNRIDELTSMLTIFVPALVVAVLVLAFTRKYWTGMRRI